MNQLFLEPPLLFHFLPCISFCRKMSINPYIYIYAVSHAHSLTARRIQTLLCYASSSCYYLTYPTVMDFSYTLPTYALFLFFFFLHSLTRVPQAGLVGGLRNDCHYSSFSLSLFLLVYFLSFFSPSSRFPCIIIRYPCFALKKIYPLEVAPFYFIFPN